MRFRWLGREGALRHNTRSTVGMLWYCNLFWRIDGEDVVRFVVYGCQCVAGIAVRCGIGISLRGCEREVIWCREVRQGGDMLYPCIWEHKEGTRLATTRVLLKFCMRGTSTGSVVSYDNVDSIHDHADNENGNNKPRKAKPNLYLSFQWLGCLTPSKFEDDVCTLLRICIRISAIYNYNRVFLLQVLSKHLCRPLWFCQRCWFSRGLASHPPTQWPRCGDFNAVDHSIRGFT